MALPRVLSGGAVAASPPRRVTGAKACVSTSFCILCSGLYPNLVWAAARGRPSGLGPQSLWPTPVFTDWFNKGLDANKVLVPYVRKLAGGVSPGGEWRSPGNHFFKDAAHAGGAVAEASQAVHKILSESAVAYLREALGEESGLTGRLRVVVDESWVRVIVGLAPQAPHVRARTSLAGAYFVDCGSSKAGSPGECLVALEDPRSPAAGSDLPPLLRERLGFGMSQHLQLRAGTVLIHPPWLVHMAVPQELSGSRIAISFTADVQYQEAAAAVPSSASKPKVAERDLDDEL